MKNLNYYKSLVVAKLRAREFQLNQLYFVIWNPPALPNLRMLCGSGAQGIVLMGAFGPGLTWKIQASPSCQIK